MSVEDEFREAMARRGLTPRTIVGDGRIHRCDVEGKPGKKSGAYVLHLDMRPAGAFCNFADGGEWEKWKSGSTPDLTPAEWLEARRLADEKAKRDHEQRLKDEQEAARFAAGMWNRARPCATHPYLERKQVPSYGLREVRGRLLIPVVSQGREITSLQFIADDGTKRFVPRGRKRGGFFAIGSWTSADEVALCEGYATGASIHLATGMPVVVAFDCHNLLPVAEWLKESRPNRQVVVCADDDAWNEQNPGRTKGELVAGRTGGRLVLPVFSSERQRGWTDFNDLHAAEGLEAVRRCFSSASPNHVGR